MKKPSYALLFFITLVVLGSAIFIKPQKKISERVDAPSCKHPMSIHNGEVPGSQQAKVNF